MNIKLDIVKENKKKYITWSILFISFISFLILRMFFEIYNSRLFLIPGIIFISSYIHRSFVKHYDLVGLFVLAEDGIYFNKEKIYDKIKIKEIFIDIYGDFGSMDSSLIEIIFYSRGQSKDGTNNRIYITGVNSNREFYFKIKDHNVRKDIISKIEVFKKSSWNIK